MISPNSPSQPVPEAPNNAKKSPFASAPHEQSADFVELFFDLVFVFAITRVTHFTAHHLDLPHILQSMLVFWLVWWAWTQLTWTLNAADTSHSATRLATLIATALAFVMAASVDVAFQDGAMWFAIPYLLVRVVGMGLLITGGSNQIESTRMAPIGAAVLVGFVAVIVGALADPEMRHWWWMAAVAADFFAGYLGTRERAKDASQVRVVHFIERHALIVIIALGESLIVAGSAVASDERTPMLLLVGGAAVLVTCLLWWTYFGWVCEFLEEELLRASPNDRSRLATQGFSYLHFPLVSGVISLAVAFEKILSHPAEPLGIKVVMALAVGVGLFVGSTAGTVWRVSGKILWPRLTILSASSLALVFAVGKSPAVGLGIVAVALILIVALEQVSSPHVTGAAEHEQAH